MDEDFIVTIQDARALGYCRRGSYVFSQRYGIDWTDFVRNGVRASVLRQIDDDMVKSLLQQAKSRIEASV